MKNKLHKLQQRSLVLVLLTLLAFAPGMKGLGQAVLYEDFNYTPPAYIGGNGNAGSTSNNWTTHSVTGGQTTTIDVVSGNLSYPGLLAPSGYKVSMFGNANATSRDINRAITATGNVQYYSVLLNIVDNAGITATGDYFMHFAATAGTTVTIFGGRLGAKTVSSGTKFRFMIQNTSGGTPTFTEFAQDLTFGTTYLVVVKYDKSTSPTTASLWVNPTSLGGTEPAGSVSNNSGTGSFAAFASICLRNNGTTPKVEIDEIRIGPTWADVTPAGTPLITVTPNTLTGFTYVQGSGPSPEQSFSISGVNLTNDISIVPPADYEISTLPGVSFSPTNPIPLTQTGGTVGATTIFVRLKAGLTVNTYNGETITASSSGATNATVTCDGSVTAAPLPTITINPITLTGFTAISGTESASQNYTVSGDNLTTYVTVNAPAKYEVSTDDVTFTPSVDLPQSGGNIIGEPKTVYVRIAATAAAGTANGDVAHTSTNATTVNLAVTGNVYLPEPSNHAAAFVATATGFSSINLTWSDNDGTQPATGFLVLANTTGTFTDPVDGTPQTDDFVLSDGSGVRNIAHSIQSCTWTGLSPSTPYYFAIYAYTNSGAFINYKVIPAAPTANVTTLVYIEPLAAWTFDATPAAPNTPTSITANAGTQLTATFYADGTNGSSEWLLVPSGAPELTAFGGTTLNDPRITPLSGNAIVLANSTANGKSVVFKYSMMGYIDPILTFATRGTASGFTTHVWAWSTDNVTYTVFGTNTANTTSNFLLRTLDMSSINDLDQAGTVYLKLTVSGATGETGNNRLDNVVLNATSATVVAPLTQAHDITFGSVLANSMTVNWTSGDGARRIVIMNTSNSFTDPLDGTDPDANPVYGGSGQQVVYNSNGNSVPVSGLTQITTYWFRVYEYNGSLTTTKYLTSTATLNPNSQITSPPAAVAPTITDPVSSVITDNSALLGGNITSDGGTVITERGTVWNTVTGVTIDDNKLAEGGLIIGTFSHTRSPLPAKTHIFFKAYASNSAGTSLTNEASFFTLASEPTSHVAGFTAVAAGTASIDLSWTAPATGADGYLILKRAGADAPTGIPSDAIAYTVGTAIGDGTVAADVLPGTTLAKTITGLSQSTQYSFTIIPYAYNGSDYQTYNYYTAASIPSATATTATPPAGALLYESFDYTVPDNIGGNTAASGTTNNNWTTHSNNQPGTIDVLSGSLSYTGLTASAGNKVLLPGNNATTPRDVNRAILSNTNTVMYYSMLINVLDNTQLSATTPDYFMHFGQTAGTPVTIFGGRLGIKSVNTAANYRLSILNTSGGTTPPYTEFAQDLNFGTTYLVVVKYDRGTSPTTAYLWVDPVSLGGAEPSGFVSNTSGTGAFNAFASICLRNTANTPKAEIDEIRVGSTWADVTPAGEVSKTLNLKLFLEGLCMDRDLGSGLVPPPAGEMYSALNDMGVPNFGDGIADKVTIELHDAANYANPPVLTFPDVELSTAGNISIPGISALYSGPYYITVKHHNSIETTTADPVLLTAGTTSYDFSTAAEKAYGSNMKAIHSVFAIFGGNSNQDPVGDNQLLIDSGDMNDVENASVTITFGYVVTDCNGDGIVDSGDMNMVENNSVGLVGVITP